jgi:hypothetical protein
VTITRAPVDTSAAAIAAPKPLVAPVMIVRVPSRRIGTVALATAASSVIYRGVHESQHDRRGRIVSPPVGTGTGTGTGTGVALEKPDLVARLILAFFADVQAPKFMHGPTV